MRIGELAKKTGIAASRIRFYEEEGILPSARREANGYRSYPDGAADAVVFIERAQQLGFSLREIASALSDAYARLPTSAAMLASLRTKLKEVDRHLAATRAVRKKIARFIRELESC